MNNGTKAIAALWLVLMANYLDRVAISFAAPSIMKSLAMSPSQFGLVLSSFSFGYFLALIPGGMIADRWGARNVMVIGSIFWALFTGLTGLVSGLIGFVIVRALFGMAEGACNPSFFSIVGENFASKKRAGAISIFSSAGPAASAFAGTLVALLIGSYGWQTMFVLMMGPALMAAMVSYFLIPNRTKPVAASPATAHADGASLRSVLRHPQLWVLSLAALCWNIPYWGYLGWMPSYLALEHHLDLKALGPASSIPYVFGVIGMLTCGWLGSTVFHRHCAEMVIGLFFAAALSLFLAYQAPSLPLTIAGLSGAAFCLYGGFGPIGKLVLELAPERFRASYFAIYSTAGQIGAVIAPAVIGLLVDRTGSFASGFGFMIVAFCVASACLFVLSRWMPQADEGLVPVLDAGLVPGERPLAR